MRTAVEYAPAWQIALLPAQLFHVTGHDAESQNEAKAALRFAGSPRSDAAQALRELRL
jgi:hypothetical protein